MATLSERVASLEKTNVAFELLLTTLREKDTETAQALGKLEDVINHPRSGLVVTIDQYQASAKADRRAQLAFFAGLVVLVNIIAPFAVPIVLHWVGL